jgi:homoserine O-acetyltransferase
MIIDRPSKADPLFGTNQKRALAMSLDYEVYNLGDVKLQRGATLRDCKLAYKTFGTLSPRKDNVILYPTWYSGQHYDNEWLVGDGRALDPNKFFIIIPNMFGNGLSSSPSNTPEPYNGPRFPQVTACDNVRAQHRLVTEKFEIEHIRLVTGWSMGALQTFHWAALYPDMMDLIAPFCGSAKCSRHNFVFLEGVKAALTADAAWKEGWYTEKPQRGLRAAARVYAGWGFSQAFYRQKLDIEALGYSSLEDFLVAFWEGFFLPKDPNNLLTMLWTWQNGDISDNELYNGDFKVALSAIKARAYVMPGQTDLYFPPEDSEFEVAHMPNANLVPVPSIWGHFAGGPGTNPKDVDFIDAKLKELLVS